MLKAIGVILYDEGDETLFVHDARTADTEKKCIINPQK